MDVSASAPPRPDLRIRLAGAAAECLVYGLLVLCLISRGRVPEMALRPLTLVLALVAALPLWAFPSRREAGLVARIAMGMGLLLLLQLRSPIWLPALGAVSPRNEELTLSLEALVVLGLAVALLLSSGFREGDDSGEKRPLARVVLLCCGAAALFCAALWPVLDNALKQGRSDGLFYADTAASLSVLAEGGVLFACCLLAEPLWRARRMALAIGLALIARGMLPPSVVS